ncbi:TonB-dependent receptor [Polaribacter batillariae]|uniref:TonB-dependent receptor n=1 Tax=Polaribacter batillariae TaxID=2808900 RepID=A0ABX7T1Z9_9FLAO|nr:carboxypeptidase-like regulatory domain-containing protein [Polaribacter batillariae]QTD39073.1 TonB-dependent receptor [Polaribacter batillariae]
MKHFKNLLFVLLFFVTATVLGQTKLTGKVVDETNQPLPGASVVVKGTTNGTSTDFDGNFTLRATTNSGTIAVSFIGYKTKEVAFSSAKASLGTIKLEEDANSLEEIVIKGIIDIAKDRETPVAVSTIKASEIQEKLGSQEFPEILSNTPSVYATKSGGGFGDARIDIRGFSQENIAVLINGVPVNDMENGRVFWSNWAGLADVTTAMQVQRGLGSSKLAISSVGGTINIVTKTTDKKQGGTVMSSIGNDGYFKNLVSYSTGKNENGFAASVLLSRTAGDGYVDGTQFEGYNYFIGLGWELNDNHDLQFLLTGAPQTHNQRTTSFFNMATLSDYLRYGKKYNYNHGYLNGKEFNWRKNFYHKPLTSINWNWNINEKSSLTTSAYVSFGRGGGTGDIGRLGGNFASSSRFRDPNTGLVQWDEIVKANSGQGGNFASGYSYANSPDPTTGTFIVNDDGLRSTDIPAGLERRNGFIRRASVNSHNWYGLLSNYNVELNENLSLDFGIDLRSYRGIHYRRIDNLLGADGYRDNDNINKPLNTLTTEYSSDLSSQWNVFRDTDDEEKINYHNDGKVRWFGTFTQLEYKKDNISAFVQAAISQQGYKRIDFFNYLDSDPAQETNWQNFIGGNIKAGLNWNINEVHNVFGNIGYYSKQPFFDAIFLNFRNDINPDAVNEKVFGVELGYGIKSERFKANVNVYRTQWKDRFVFFGFENAQGEEGNAQLQGITQLHTGAELDFTFDVTDQVRLLGTASVGNWRYKDRITGTAFDDFQNPIGTIDLDVEDVKVGNSPQSIFRIGFDVKPFENFKIDINQRFNDRLFSALVIDDSLSDDATTLDPAIELPGYSLTDLGLSYKWNLTESQSINFRLNVNNLFDEEYIAESATNYEVGRRGNFETYRGINTDNKLFFGFGRTWNFTARYNF